MLINKFINMTKKIVLAAGAVLVAAAVSAFVCVNNGRTSMDDLFYANVEALADGEGGYACPGACLTWTGSWGGGLDCMCGRYTGRCQKWC